MKVAITGGCGHLGQVLGAQLLAEGHGVLLLDLRKPDGLPAGTEFLQVDVTDPATLAGAFDGCDAVLHLAAVLMENGHPERFDRVNHRGTCHVRDEALRAGVRRFVLVSSISVTYRQGNDYSRSKIRAEECLAGCAIPEVAILRPTLVVCDGGAEEFASFARIVRKLPILPLPSCGTARKRPIHAQDLAQAISRACTVPLPGRTFLELGGSQALTLSEMARAIRRKAKRSIRIVPVPHWLARLSASLSESLPAWCGLPRLWNRQILSGLLEDADPSIEAACETLVWSPRGFDEFLPTTRLPGERS